jgi:hypothetical protein
VGSALGRPPLRRNLPDPLLGRGQVVRGVDVGALVVEVRNEGSGNPVEEGAYRLAGRVTESGDRRLQRWEPPDRGEVVDPATGVDECRHVVALDQ